MRRKSRLSIALAFLTLLAGHSTGHAQSAAGLEEIYPPSTHGNLRVTFLHGRQDRVAAPLALSEAVSSGQAQVHLSPSKAVVIDNFSDREVFIQAGELLIGGVQDQVASTGLVVPPKSNGTEIESFCVNRRRTDPRGTGQDSSFAISPTVMPPNVAWLNLVTRSEDTNFADQIRQFGIWLGVESLRARLSEQLGVSIDPEDSPSSLPMALKNDLLDAALLPYLDALETVPEKDGEIVGVIFAIDGRNFSADVYSSSALFRQMWPKLLRAHAIQAIAARSPLYHASYMESGERMLSADVRRPDGSVVHTGYIDKYAIPVTPLEKAAYALLTSPNLKNVSAARADEVGLAKALSLPAYQSEPEHFVETVHQALAAGLFAFQPETEKAIQRAMASNTLRTYTDLRRVIDRVDPNLPNVVPDSERPIARFIDGGIYDPHPNDKTKDQKAAAWSWLEFSLVFFAAMMIAFLLSVAVYLARRAVRDIRLRRESAAERHRKNLADAPRRAPPATAKPESDRLTAPTPGAPKHDRRISIAITSAVVKARAAQFRLLANGIRLMFRKRRVPGACPPANDQGWAILAVPAR